MEKEAGRIIKVPEIPRLEMTERLPESVFLGKPQINTDLQMSPHILNRLIRDNYSPLRTVLLGRGFMTGRDGSFYQDHPPRLIPPDTARGLLVKLNQNPVNIKEDKIVAITEQPRNQYPMALFGKGNGMPVWGMAPRARVVNEKRSIAYSWVPFLSFGMGLINRKKGYSNLDDPKVVGKVLSLSHSTEGLLRYQGARRDWDISMLLHEYGARVSLPFAICELNPNALNEWGKQRMQEEIPWSTFPLDASINQMVKTRKDEPVLFYRFGDDVRIRDLWRINDSEGIYSRKSIISRAANSFMLEINDLGGVDNLCNRYGINPNILPKLHEHLKNLIDGDISQDAIASYSTLVAGVIGYNYGIMDKVGGKIAQKRLGYRLKLANPLGHLQDIGITGRQHDFEDQATKADELSRLWARLTIASKAREKAIDSAEEIYRVFSGETATNILKKQFYSTARISFYEGAEKKMPY